MGCRFVAFRLINDEWENAGRERNTEQSEFNSLSLFVYVLLLYIILFLIVISEL